MNKGKQKNKFRLPISAYITYLLLATVLLTGVTFSKYTTKSTSIDEARVARFDVEIMNASDVSLELEAGSQETYSFKVQNKSEVALKYNLLVENLPEGISITVNDGKAYNAYRNLDIGEIAELELTFTAGAEVSDVNGTVNISVNAEQIN